MREGELVAVLGANGAGKTTLMRTIVGLNRARPAPCFWLGERIEAVPASRIVGEGLVLVPEGRQVFPELSVLDNIRLGAYARPRPTSRATSSDCSTASRSCESAATSAAGLLSGGEQQMLAIARGLSRAPRAHARRALARPRPHPGRAPL